MRSFFIFVCSGVLGFAVAACGDTSETDPGSAGFRGPPVALTAATDVREILLDAEFVYWTEFSGGVVRKIPREGGTPETLASGLDKPSHLDQTETHLYFAQAAAIVRVPKAGGMVETVATSSYWPRDLVLDSSSVYWIDNGTVDNDVVSKAPLDGGNAVAIADVVYGTGTMGMHGDDLYVSGGPLTDTVIARVPKAGGSPAVLATGLGYVFTLEGDEQRLYFRDGQGEGLDNPVANIVSMPYAGGALHVLANKLPGPTDVTIDTAHVYWGDRHDYGIYLVPKEGGARRQLAEGQQGIIYLAVDDTALYWAANGSLMKLAR